MKTPKKSGKISNQKTAINKSSTKSPITPNNKIVDDEDDFDVPLDEIEELDRFNDFEDEDDY